MKRDLRIGTSSRIRRARIWSRGFQIAITFAAVVNLAVAALQWHAMREALEGDQRAWVLLGSVVQRVEIQAGKPFTLDFFVNSVGKSPAQDARVVTRTMTVTPADAGVPTDDGVLFAGVNMSRQSISVLGPNHPVQLRFGPTTLSPEQIAGVLKGTHRLYLVAKITYGDQFRRDRLTRFCLYLEPPGDLRICPFYNEIR